MKETVGQKLLTMLQSQHDGASLHAVSQILCISSQNVYQIAKGQRHMASDTILIACDCLQVDARPWLIRAEIDTCKSPQRRQILYKILADLEPALTRAVAGVLAFFMVGNFAGF